MFYGKTKLKEVASMVKRYRKMTKKANGKIREIADGQVVLELPLPVANGIGWHP